MTATGLGCGSCGTELPPNSKFCDECGAAVATHNAQAESFLGHNESRVLDRYLWPTKAAAKLAVGDWIERVYNRRGRHSAIGMISPVDFEDRLTRSAQAA